jgi:hypothetical protein
MKFPVPKCQVSGGNFLCQNVKLVGEIPITEVQNGRKQTTITTRNVQRDVLCRRLPSSRALTSWIERVSVAHEVGPCDDDDHGGEGGAFLA